jgi:hypothetical protein
VLRDGTFLVAVVGRGVLHVGAAGAVIREYPVPGAYAVALDIDGTSFWTNAGNYLLRIDIATGDVLSETFTEFQIQGLSVVGEPRGGQASPATVDVPLTASALLILGVALAALSLCRLA